MTLEFFLPQKKVAVKNIYLSVSSEEIPSGFPRYGSGLHTSSTALRDCPRTWVSRKRETCVKPRAGMGSIILLMEATGHSTEEMFQRYIQAADSSRALELGRHFEKLRIDCI